MKNERGSVISAAVIIIVLLSFALTTTSAYTFNVATRTNTIQQNTNEEQFARAIVNSVINDIKTSLDQTMRSFEGDDQEALRDAFKDALNAFEDETRFEIIEAYRETVEAYYLANFGIERDIDDILSISLKDIPDEDSVSRTYVVSFRRENNRRIFRELLLALKADPEQGTIDPEDAFESVGDVFDSFMSFLDPTPYPDGDGIECGNDCSTAFEDEFKGGGNQPFDMTRNVYVDGNLELTSANQGDGAGANTEIKLNGNMLVVTGDLTLKGIHNLVGGETDLGGLIIVEGNLTIVRRHVIENTSLTILVGGDMIIEADPQSDGIDRELRAAPGSFFHFIAFRSVEQDVPSYILEKGETYYEYWFTETTGIGGTYEFNTFDDKLDGNGKYVGSDENFPGLTFLITEYANLLDLPPATFSDIYDDALGPFKETED